MTIRRGHSSTARRTRSTRSDAAELAIHTGPLLGEHRKRPRAGDTHTHPGEQPQGLLDNQIFLGPVQPSRVRAHLSSSSESSLAPPA